MGCQQSASRHTIAVIPRDTAEEVWSSEHGGAAAAAQRHGLSVYWNGPNREDDAEQQIALAERAVHARDYGILLSPNHPFELTTIVQRALDRSIPLVLLGSRLSIKPSPHLSYVLSDAKSGGAQAAARISTMLHGRGEVVVIGVDPMSPGSVDRANAFERALERESPDIQVAERLIGSPSFGQAEQATETVLHTHPHLAAIVTLNINATRGAYAAIHAAGLDRRVKIVGWDQALDLLFLLRHGQIDSIVVQNTRAMGYIGVEQLVAEAEGRPVPPYVYVKPALVTRDNVDEDRIQQMLDMDWRELNWQPDVHESTTP